MNTAYRRMVESANAGIWVLDRDGNTTFANAKMAEILGYDADHEITRLSLFERLDDNGRQQAARNLERCRQEAVDVLECTLMRNNGSETCVLLSVSALRSDDGDFDGSLCVISEFTEHQHLAQTLHRREQQLADAQRVAHLGSWEWDVVSDTITWSDELFRIFKLNPQELTPTYEGYLARVHPDDREMVEAAVGAALGSDEAFEFEARIVRPGSEVVWTQSRGQVTRDPTGTPLRMHGTALDITNAKVAEQALRTTSERYQLLQAMAAAANEAVNFEDALHVAVEQICRHTVWAMGRAYLPSDAAGGGLVPAPISHLDESGRFAGVEWTEGADLPATNLADQASASRAPVWTSDLTEELSVPAAEAAARLGARSGLAFPVVVQGGGVVAALEFFADAPMQPDEDLLGIIAQVGSQLARVAERERVTADLALARDAARESSRLKSEFLATMSHEIRTPMNGVIGLTALLLGTDLDERQRRYAEGVKAAGDALLAVINDILDFSKIEAGKLELESVGFDLVSVVEEATELLAEPARQKGLALAGYCQPDVPTALVGDPERIRQVLVNLASNAVKFTMHGEVVVTARSAGPSRTDELIRFEVVDTGIGIEAADRHRLFEPFSQADASTTRRFGGTGLGLAISYQLVSAMGGEIGVESEPGRGSTFWFTVPLRRQPAGVAPPARVPAHLLQGLRVLVVDDNETNRFILGEQLRNWGMRPDLVADAQSAVARLRTGADAGDGYALALLDLCMDDEDGLELARRISSGPVRPPLVLLSSTPDVRASAAAAAGFADVLIKPVRQSQLYDCLMRVTAPSSMAASEPVSQTVTRAGGVPGRRGHVLVVEDNAINQMVAQGILEDLGFSADLAFNGVEALEALEAKAYAAVLMDCQMPEMDGYATTAAIRHREGTTRHTPILAMTASAVEGDRERCLASGMDDYLPKPVQPGDLEVMLDHWVGPGEAGGAASTGHGRDPSHLAVLDHQQLRMLGQRLPEGSLPSVLAAFLAETPRVLVVLQEAVAAGDADALRQHAHRLRGTAATLGAPGMAAILRDLEELDRHDLRRAHELLRRLRRHFGHVARSLRESISEPMVPVVTPRTD